uniref:U1740t n=1 Tax=Mycobacterium leprae TaxID=1769 RepID=Q50080_MYCLR|nr:u1740t [Mycobacterium leprae]
MSPRLLPSWYASSLSQLWALSLIVNQAACEIHEPSVYPDARWHSGWPDAQHPDALDLIRATETQGVRIVIARRDGPFDNYSQAVPKLRPDPSTCLLFLLARKPRLVTCCRSTTSKPRKGYG